MDKERIEKAMDAFWELSPSSGDRPYVHGNGGPASELHDELSKAIAEHLAAELVTFDELVEVLKQHGDREGTYMQLVILKTGAGWVEDMARYQSINWPATDTPGKDAIAGIKAAMPPDLTEKEKALEALEQVTGIIEAATWSKNLLSHMGTIREALETKW